MELQMISIILSSITAIIAIIISIISINKQTKSQNINATIQLFDKRFEIYNYVLDMWFVIGYFDGKMKALNLPYKYENIIKLSKLTDPIIEDKINDCYTKCEKFAHLYKPLFSGKSFEYLKRVLPLFKEYIKGVYHKQIFKNDSEIVYQEIKEILKMKNFGMDDLQNFIDLSDVKRLDN